MSLFELLNSQVKFRNRQIPIGQLSNPNFESLPKQIIRKGNSYQMSIKFSMDATYQEATAFTDSLIINSKGSYNPGTYLSRQSSSNENEPNFFVISTLLVFSIFCTISVLLNHLKNAFIVVSCIPVSFIGVFLIFGLFDSYFDIGGYVAFLLVTGISINSVLYIFNDLNNLKKESSDNGNTLLLKAILGKAEASFITSATTIFGLLPFVLIKSETHFWFSLSIGTIGGTIFSLFAIFIWFPILMWKPNEN
jgi:multidrug efflux pump subunit AcrB